MRIIPFILCLAACGTSEPSAATKPASAPAVEAPAENETQKGASRVALIAPDQLTDILGKESGRVRVFNFWATWCQPCIAELPHLSEVASRHPEAEVLLVSLDHRAVGTPRVKAFLDKQGLSMQSFMLDAEDPASAMLEVYDDFPGAIPITLVMDSSGELHKAFHRAITAEELSEAIQNAS